MHSLSQPVVGCCCHCCCCCCCCCWPDEDIPEACQTLRRILQSCNHLFLHDNVAVVFVLLFARSYPGKGVPLVRLASYYCHYFYFQAVDVVVFVVLYCWSCETIPQASKAPHTTLPSTCLLPLSLSLPNLFPPFPGRDVLGFHSIRWWSPRPWCSEQTKSGGVIVVCTRQNCINRQLVITIKPRRKGNVQPQYLPKEEKKGVGKSWSAQTGLVADDLPYLCSLYHLHKIYIQISIYLYTDMYIHKYTNA